jgi:hypothetical protein
MDVLKNKNIRTVSSEYSIYRFDGSSFILVNTRGEYVLLKKEEESYTWSKLSKGEEVLISDTGLIDMVKNLEPRSREFMIQLLEREDTQE